jgi:hypothetical protein
MIVYQSHLSAKITLLSGIRTGIDKWQVSPIKFPFLIGSLSGIVKAGIRQAYYNLRQKKKALKIN